MAQNSNNDQRESQLNGKSTIGGNNDDVILRSTQSPSALEAALAIGVHGLKMPNRKSSNSTTVVKRTVITMDSLLDRLECPGFAQIFVYVLICLNVFPVSLNFMAMSIYGASPNQTCHVPNEWSNFNESVIPRNAKDGKLEKCLIYQNPNDTSLGTMKCPNGYDYHLYGKKYPITAEWDLVCDQAYLVRTAQSIFFVGVMFGGMFFGFLADRFGRRTITLITLYSQAILGVGVAFSTGFPMFVVLKFLQGMMIQGLQTSNQTMAMELFQTRYRTIAGMIVAMLATSCSMLIGLISYLIPHWRHIQLFISLPTIITVVFIWVLPESLRWLLSHKKIDDAMKIAKTYARRNKIELPSNLRDDMETLAQEISENATQSVQGNIRDLLRVPVLRRTSFILFLNWFTASVVYYGITFAIPELGGNASLNFFIVGALETISRFIGYFIIKRFGRRIPLSIAFILSGILCSASAAIGRYLQDKNSDLSLVTTMMALLGRASMGQCFAFLLILTSEVYPTVLRSAGAGACTVWQRIGGIIAPQILLLERFVGKSVPFIVFGVLAIVCGTLTLMIPETINVPLPDTVKDSREFHEKPDAVTQSKTSNSKANGVPNEAFHNEEATKTTSDDMTKL